MTLTGEEQGEDDTELVDGVTGDVLHHGAGDQGLLAAVGFAAQQGLGGRLRGQSQRRKGVHDQVHPQHLHGLQRRVLDTQGEEGALVQF